MVVFGYVDDEAQVGVDQLVAGFHIAFLNPGRKLNFALAAQRTRFGDVVKIEAQRIFLIAQDFLDCIGHNL